MNALRLLLYCHNVYLTDNITSQHIRQPFSGVHQGCVAFPIHFAMRPRGTKKKPLQTFATEVETG